MRRVILESPYAGDIVYNVAYLRACLHDSLVNHGEAPFASHGLYTQPGVLRDDDPHERDLGMSAGFTWGTVADATIVYMDLGVSPGMTRGIQLAREAGRAVEYRRLGEPWSTPS